MVILFSTDRKSQDEVVKPGRLISGVVEQITPNTIIISIDVDGYTKGTLSTEHLADNEGDICRLACMLWLAPAYI